MTDNTRKCAKDSIAKIVSKGNNDRNQYKSHQSVSVPIKKSSPIIELKQKIDGIGMKNPVHIEAYHIPFLVNEMKSGRTIMITPKTDGLTCHITMDGHVFETEKYCDPNNIDDIAYYIFDLIRSSAQLSKKIESRIKTLQNLTKCNILYDLDCNDFSESELRTKIYSIVSTEQIFCKNLIIKPVIKIKNCKNDKLIQELFRILSKKPITQYLNDGWIIYVDDHQTPLKFKPIDEMTIDLLVTNRNFYARDCTDVSEDVKHQTLVPLNFLVTGDQVSVQDNIIYRCLPCLDDTGTLTINPLSQRPDKAACNRTDTVNHVIHRIRKNWHVDNVLNFYKSINHVYYDHIEQPHTTDLLDQSIEKLLTMQRMMSKNTLDLIKIKNMTMLDLGCGNGSLGRYAICSKELKQYYGIDKDPVLLGSNIGNLPNQSLIWGDPNNSDMEYYSNYEKEGAFSGVDVITIMNSIHYFDLDMIMRICNISTKNPRYIIIYGLFSENISILSHPTSKVTFGESFWISNNNSNNNSHTITDNSKDTYEFMYPWKSSPFNESIYRLQHVIHTFTKSGWILDYCDTVQLDEALKSGVCSMTARRYEGFITMHNRIVFKNFT